VGRGLSSGRLSYSARPRRGKIILDADSSQSLWPQARSVRDGLLQWCAEHHASSTMAVWVVKDIVEAFTARTAPWEQSPRRKDDGVLDWCKAGYMSVLEPRRRVTRREPHERALTSRCGGWYSLVPILWGFSVDRSSVKISPPPGQSGATVLKVWRLALGALDIEAERRRACRTLALWWGRRFGGLSSCGDLLRECFTFICAPPNTLTYDHKQFHFPDWATLPRSHYS